MATDERFGLLPYAGVDPTSAMIYSLGTDTMRSGGFMWKAASGVASDSITPVSVYYFNLGAGCYLISEYTSQGNTIYTSNGTSKSEQVITSVYTVPTTTIRVRYFNLGEISVFIPGDASALPAFSSLDEAALAFLALFPDDYVNISYVGNGCSVGGPSYVETGTGVLAPVTLPIGTSLTADNISVTKNGVSIDFNYNPQTRQIAFTAI